MPGPIIAALAASAIASSATTIAVLGAFGAAAAGAIAAVAINAAFAAIRKPDSPTAIDLSQTSQTLTTLEPAAYWEVVYGEVRKGGKLVFRHATDTVELKITGEDAVIPPDGQYQIVGGTWVSHVAVEVVDIDNEGSTVSTLLDPSEYSVSAGGLYTFNTADAGKRVVIRYNQQVVAQRRALLHLVIVLAAHEVEEIGDIYFDDEVVPIGADHYATGRYGGWHVYLEKHLGGPGQEANAHLMSHAPDKWLSTFRLSGHAYLYVMLVRDREVFTHGVPNITAMVKGKKVYDPRGNVTAYQNNAALCIADYLSNSVYGLGAAYGTEIDNTYLTFAANACDEAVTLAGGGTEPRYTCNGVIRLSETPQDILEKMLTSCAGRMVYVGGKWRIHAGTYITPTLTLDEGDARSSIKRKILRQGNELFNGVKGVYLSPENHWQPSDFPPVRGNTYLLEDGNHRVWQEIDLPFTTSAARAQRIAKVVLERVRRQGTVSYPAKLAAYKVQPPETIMLNNTQLGFSSAVFEITQLGLVFEDTENGPILGVNLELQKTDSSVYTWTTADEEIVAPAPTTNLPDPFSVAPPGLPVIVEEQYETLNGVRVRARVSWGASPDGQATNYDLEWKRDTESQWNQHPGLISANDFVADIAPGTFDFRVRARSAIGVSSIWSQTRASITGLAVAPSTPFITGIMAIGGAAFITITEHPDLDVRRGGKILVRHSEATSSAVWEESFSIGDEKGYPGDSTTLIVPLKAGTYLIKAQDSGERQSSTPSTIGSKQASVHAFTTTDTVTESPGFSGTHSGTTATGGIIKLSASGDIDSVADFDAISPSIDALGGILTEGTYTFAAGMDFGAVSRRRLTGKIDGIVVNEADLIDTRTNNIDDWLDFDGSAGGTSTDAWLESRETDDDPTGTPTWNDWKRLDVTEVDAWGVEFRLQIRTHDPAYNQHVDTLAVTAASV